MPLTSQLCKTFFVPGKQNTPGLQTRKRFESRIFGITTRIFHDCTGPVLVLLSPYSVLLDSGGPRIRIHQIHLHKSRTKIRVVSICFLASSVHYHSTGPATINDIEDIHNEEFPRKDQIRIRPSVPHPVSELPGRAR
ncbi:MAG TPA: hypothetical protein VGK01_09950, partial [Candidatus Angelobacter sp.]